MGAKFSEPSPSMNADDLKGAKLDGLLDLKDQYTVLESDFSQLLAVDAARRGSNLVIHGPPGTGKSQTIVNIIATLLGEGKRVLFVSEKRAALEVVVRRLRQLGLDLFCLDLHTDGGDKNAVYEQLRASLDDPRRLSSPSDDLRRLQAVRERLNTVVRQLHEKRMPLGSTVFEMQGRFAAVREAPHVEINIPRDADLDETLFGTTLSVARRLSGHRAEFLHHFDSPWRSLRPELSHLGVADALRSALGAHAVSCERAAKDVQEINSAIGAQFDGTYAATDGLVNVLRHLRSAPGVPVQWLKDGNFSELASCAREQSDLQQRRKALASAVAANAGGKVPDIDYGTLMDAFEFSVDEIKACQVLIGPKWRERIVRDCQELKRLVQEASAAVEILEAPEATVCELLELPGHVTLLALGDVCSPLREDRQPWTAGRRLAAARWNRRG